MKYSIRPLAPALALALALAVTLAGCGGGGSDEESSSDASFNDADVTFAQSMIPHHRQALEMAKTAGDRASSPEVKDLAAGIEAAQGPEIKTMSGWLESWGKEVPSGSMGEMEGMSSGDMPGMMSEQDMNALKQAEGAAFDRLFLTQMIKHHTSAIDMARTEQAEGKNADAVALAKRIESEQAAEIKRMRALLGS